MLSPSSPDSPASRLATRIAFFIPGFGVACWAPLVPFVKSRMGVDEAQLGMLLLCLGLGSVVAMPLAAGISSRFGSRYAIAVGAFVTAAMIPLLAFGTSLSLVAMALLFFGASLGAMDVAANIHGTEVQKAAGIPLMSNFHGLYSIGGLAGALIMTLMLSSGLHQSIAASIAALIILILIAIAIPRLLKSRAPADAPLFAIPRGITLIIGFLACALFLIEGAVLDWGAVLLTDLHQVAAERAGIGYVLFSLAMTIGRLTGDVVVHRFGSRNILRWGSLLSSIGVAIPAFVPGTGFALSGFFLLGLGASNLVPILFTAAGNQKTMPPDMAIAAVSIMGYAGILCGPGLIGFLAQSTSLSAAFGILAAAVLAVIFFASRIARIQH